MMGVVLFSHPPLIAPSLQSTASVILCPVTLLLLAIPPVLVAVRGRPAAEDGCVSGS